MIKDNENVSIIIATHNNVDTINKALDSATRGIRSADSVIVGDNDSRDGTYELLCDLFGAKPITIEGQTGLPPKFSGEMNGVPVLVFKKQLSTIGHTNNIAMQMQYKGVTIFGFLDPNSWYAGDKIAQSIRAFVEHPSIACVISDFDNHHEDGRLERIFCNSFDIQRLLTHYPYDRNFLVRTQVFAKMQCGFNEQMPMREDYDLLLRMSKVGLLYHIPAPLHHNNVSAVDDDKRKMIMQSEAMAKESFSQRRGQTNV